MNKFLTLLVGGSLMLAGAALAQQPEEQQTPAAKQGGGKGHGQAAEAQSGANQANPGPAVGKHRGAKNQQGASAEQNPQQTPAEHQGGKHGRAGSGSNAQGTEATPKSLRRGGKANVTGEPETNASPNGDQQGQQHRHGRNARGANGQTAPAATPTTAVSASVAPSVTPNHQQTGQANTAASVGPNPQQNVQAQGTGKAKRPDPQQVQQIRQQHTNFRAQPSPDRVPAVTFNQSYRIEGSDRWQGPRYEVFRSYHPERHDERWYHSHYPRVELIGGGYYYWNNGYWFPAWGYSPANEYYAYDGPIYVGQRALPPDQVVADVQDVLKQMGYYEGEVDGLLGPLTRQALAAYQADQGLTPTAAIDEPTLDSLQMG